jgi:hypothetical protein
MTIRFLLYLLLLTYLLIVGLLRFRKLSFAFQLLTVLIGLTLISEGTSRLLILKYQNSSPVYHVFNVINAIGYSTIFYFLLRGRSSRRVALGVMILSASFSIINTIFLQTLWSFPSNFLLILCLSNVLLSLLFLKQILNIKEDIRLIRQSEFWFTGAVLVFFTVIFLNWSFYNYLVRNQFNTRLISSIMYYLNIVYYVCVGVSMHLNNRKMIAV